MGEQGDFVTYKFGDDSWECDSRALFVHANEQRMDLIDVITLRFDNLAEDFGYLVTEINYLFRSYTEDLWKAEPFLQFTYATCLTPQN